jgi:hypothetical protein
MAAAALTHDPAFSAFRFSHFVFQGPPTSCLPACFETLNRRKALEQSRHKRRGLAMAELPSRLLVLRFSAHRLLSSLTIRTSRLWWN